MARFRYKAVAPTGEVVEGEMEALARGAAIERLRELRHLPVRVEELDPHDTRPMRLVPREERIEPVLGPSMPAAAETVAPDTPRSPGEERPEPPLIERITLDQAVESLRAEFAAVATAGIRTEPPFEQTPANTDEPLVLDEEVPPEPEPPAEAMAEAAPEPAPDTAPEFVPEPVAEPPEPAGPDAQSVVALGEERESPLLRWDIERTQMPAPPAEPAARPTETGWLEWQEAAAAIAAAETPRPAAAAADLAVEPPEFAPPAAEPAAEQLGIDPTMIAPVPIEPRAEPQPQAPRKAKRGKAALPARLAPVFTRELQVLLSAGLPMDRALRIMVESTADDRVAAAADALLARVRGGALLSEAMDATPDRFDEFLRTAVRAGEAGGSLAEVLDQVAAYQERGQRLARSVRTALIYPSILAFAAAFSVILLLTLVVPQFETLFRQSAQAPPMATRAVIAASAFLRDYGWVVPAGALVLWIAARWRYADARRRARLHRRALDLPVVGAVISGVSVERLARSLATLLANGVALPEALGLVANAVPNRAVGAAASAAVDRVKQGERLADALEEGGALPPLAVQLIRVGEESGRLVDMLSRLADIYAGEVDVAVRRLTAVIEPALILVIGAVVGGIVLSLLAAIAGLNALAL